MSDLPHSSEEMEDKVAVAQALYKEGLLLILDEVTRSTHPDYKSQEGIEEDDPF